MQIKRAVLFLPLLALLGFLTIGQTGTPHGVFLTWNASPTPGVNYNIYRAGSAAGPFAKINTAPISGTSYLDPAAGLSSTQTYVYFTTAVDPTTGNESVASNEPVIASPQFPSNPAPPSGCTAKVQ